MKTKMIFGLLLVILCQPLFALQEQHLIIIRHGEGDHNVWETFNSNPQHPHYKPSHLTENGVTQVKKTAELLLNYGFDNRNIAAVYVSPLPRTMETAQLIAQVGVFSPDKIHIDKRLIEHQAGDHEGLSSKLDTNQSWFVSEEEAKAFNGESSAQVRHRMIGLYNEVVKKSGSGHIVFITHGLPAMELIESLTNNKVKLHTAQVYLVPLVKKS